MHQTCSLHLSSAKEEEQIVVAITKGIVTLLDLMKIIFTSNLVTLIVEY